mmetsp:Transcript_44550/g.128897  ORF Transcript_44550/g.128897 Transcript_44550/m.128897 type:complete len:293 (+) Transcript_44550:82-960(+)
MWRCWAILFVLSKNGEAPLDQLMFDPRTSSALILTPAKVASTSIWVTVSNAVGYFQYEEEIQETYKPILKTHFVSVARDFIKKDKSNNPIWFFASVRQPYTRYMSLYFEDIEQERYSSQERLLAMNASEMHEDFLNWYRKGNKIMEENWCESQVHQVTGVRLKDYSFPYEAGKLVVSGSAHGKSFIVVLLRFEDLKRWIEIMQPQVPWWDTVGVFKQDARELWYYDKYKEFKQTFRWPRKDAEALQSGCSMHFYTPEEQKASFLRAIEGPEAAKLPQAEQAEALHAFPTEDK